jgi:hypothetical protein
MFGHSVFGHSVYGHNVFRPEGHAERYRQQERLSGGYAAALQDLPRHMHLHVRERMAGIG